MRIKSCFPELPGGECWPRDGGAPYRGCFPDPEPGRMRHQRARNDEDLLASLARVLKGKRERLGLPRRARP